ncbi:cytochrome-c peroxidase [Burkholderia arboris]|nr:cytochrome c peroxidase [Burkholderia arboris]
MIAVAFTVMGMASRLHADQQDNFLGLPPDAREVLQGVNPRMAALGRRLFFDKHLSADGSISCASCHRPNLAFTDGLQKSLGIGDQMGTRNAPSLWNAALLPNQFWDGRQLTLEQQAREPLFNVREHGLTTEAQLIRIIQSNASYPTEFAAVFPAQQNITTENVSRALAAYERTLLIGNSPFDRYAYAGDKDAMSQSAKRGLLLFEGRAQCAACHLIGKKSAMFTDNQFHALHVGLLPLDSRLGEIAQRAFSARRTGRTVSDIVLSDPEVAELGRFVVSLDPKDIGAFRTPSLRNVALTSPYMHDGSIATLAGAIDQEIYYRTTLTRRPIILTPDEKSDLVAFLEALTNVEVESLGAE